jgi:DNA replication protein DnaC
MVDLLDQLHRDAKEDRLDHRLHTLCRPKLLILDEMGYFPLDRMTAQFFSACQPPLRPRFDHPHLEQILRRVG